MSTLRDLAAVEEAPTDRQTATAAARAEAPSSEAVLEVAQAHQRAASTAEAGPVVAA
jgi:hypothetical protein